MEDVEVERLQRKLEELKLEHRDLDDAIQALEDSGAIVDGLKVQRLKKRKLSLKDQIITVENMLIPDIIA